MIRYDELQYVVIRCDEHQGDDHHEEVVDLQDIMMGSGNPAKSRPLLPLKRSSNITPEVLAYGVGPRPKCLLHDKRSSSVTAFHNKTAAY